MIITRGLKRSLPAERQSPGLQDDEALVTITKIANGSHWPKTETTFDDAMIKPKTIDDVLNTFREHGHRHYGESVTELQHALQCATFAQQAHEPPVVVAAALLHDYGHLCHQLGEDIAEQGVDARHEHVGANLLRGLFSDEIVDAGRLHVAAKRYLCWKERAYFDDLSEASRKSLHLQGGPMSETEAREFEREPHFELAVRVRRYDDMGKVPEMRTPDLDSFRPLLETFLGPQD